MARYKSKGTSICKEIKQQQQQKKPYPLKSEAVELIIITRTRKIKWIGAYA